MPIYNGGKYLNYSLVSIQNQNMKEIEIILIDDLSPDNSLTIIERFMKYDPRIRLIKNNKNKKIMYSKSIAALNSNGEYIIELDQDDMFIRDNAFQLLYNEAKKYNLDLVQIRDFFKKKFYFIKRTPVNKLGLHFIRKKNTHYKTQPELRDKLFTEDNNYLLWGLLIRTDLYKNAIYHLWPFIMNYKIIFNEDYFITSMIAKLAKNYKFINNFALIHLKHSKSISHNHIQNKEFYLSLYLFLYYLHEYYIKKNPNNINILINYIYTDVSSFSKGIILFPTLFEYIIQIIINNDYLKYKVKQKLFQDINLDINIYKKFKSYEYIMNKNEFYNIQKYQNTIKNLQEKKQIKKSLKYNITTVIYCNQSRYLGETIYSIINQIDSFNEIIIVYDNKDEDNLKYIKNLINGYENIRIINNNENKGILYSYSVGVLNANGEFILSLQSGYTLAKKDILFKLYNTAKDQNLDILEFNLLINEHEIIRNNSLNLHKCSHFQSNKDWNIIKSDEKYKDLDQEKELLFNKIIRTDIYKNIIKDYKLNEKNIIIYNYYDNILMFLFNKYKLHFMHIDEFGVIKNNYNKDFNIINDKAILINDSISYINFLYDNSKNTFFDKTNVLKEFINILNVIYNKFTKITDNSIKLIEKFINCHFINEEAKNELQFYYKSLIN